jgi:hypothetical protein
MTLTFPRIFVPHGGSPIRKDTTTVEHSLASTSRAASVTSVLLCVYAFPASPKSYREYADMRAVDLILAESSDKCVRSYRYHIVFRSKYKFGPVNLHTIGSLCSQAPDLLDQFESNIQTSESMSRLALEP